MYERGAATLAILAFAVVHVSGRRNTARVQGGITALKVGGLCVFALSGLSIGWKNSANLNDLTPVDGNLAVALMSSMVYIYYAYTGWNSASYLAGEVKDAQRRLPQAILLGTAGVTILYLALNVVYSLALSAGDVRAITDRDGFDAVAPIAQLAASRLFGERWSALLSIGFGLMLLSTLSAYVLIGPRVVYAMARADQFPALAARLLPRAQTPAVATGLQVAIALALLWMGKQESIIVYAGVGLSIFSILSMSSIYVLRWRRPDLLRPFRTPGYPVTPAIYLLSTGALTLATFYDRPAVAFYALMSILAGVPFYYIWKSMAGRLTPRRESLN